MLSHHERRTSRRHFFAALAGIGSLAALGACTSKEGTATPAGKLPNTAEPTATKSSSDAAPRTIGYNLDPARTDVYKQMNADDRRFLDVFYARKVTLRDFVGLAYSERQHKTTLLTLAVAGTLNKTHSTDIYGMDLHQPLSAVQENPELAVDSAVDKFNVGFKLLQTYAQEQLRLESVGKTIDSESSDSEVRALLDRHRFATAIIVGDLRYTLSDKEDDSYAAQRASQDGQFTLAMQQTMDDLRTGKTTDEVNVYDYIGNIEPNSPRYINDDAYLQEDDTQVAELIYQNAKSSKLGNRYHSFLTPDEGIKLNGGRQVSMWSMSSFKTSGFVPRN